MKKLSILFALPLFLACDTETVEVNSQVGEGLVGNIKENQKSIRKKKSDYHVLKLPDEKKDKFLVVRLLQKRTKMSRTSQKTSVGYTNLIIKPP